ncbi:NAD-dependent epimerase/dehydratase family protein [Parabacteroides distasonis]|nr:NAD-dependent epimerase/dehydratase family protein [Parabacteroides distasonis]
MKKILITGAGSYVGENVRKYIMQTAGDQFVIDAVDTFGDNWKKADFSQYDVVYHVAGIAEVNGKKGMEQLYYKVNTDLTIEIAKHAQANGVKQFIFMSSMIVYKETQSLKGNIITPESLPAPNGVYGDSKLKAEEGLKEVAGGFRGVQEFADGESRMKVCILRPPMIYGPNSKSNLLRLGRLGTKVPFFPNWRNKRSMLYIDNLGEFVKQAVLRELEGTFYPQNRELSATVDIIRFFAKAAGHSIWITKLLNPFVWLGSFVLQPVNKMFADSYYVPQMSEYGFEYQIVSFEESLRRMV